MNIEEFETIIFEDRRIVFPIPESDDPKEKVEMAVRLFKKVVDVVANPTIYSL